MEEEVKAREEEEDDAPFTDAPGQDALVRCEDDIGEFHVTVELREKCADGHKLVYTAEPFKIRDVMGDFFEPSNYLPKAMQLRRRGPVKQMKVKDDEVHMTVRLINTARQTCAVMAAGTCVMHISEDAMMLEKRTRPLVPHTEHGVFYYTFMVQIGWQEADEVDVEGDDPKVEAKWAVPQTVGFSIGIPETTPGATLMSAVDKYRLLGHLIMQLTWVSGEDLGQQG